MNYLSNVGGRWLYITICIVLLLGAVLGILKFVIYKEYFSLLVAVILLSIILVAFISSYSTVSYDKKFIYIQNLRYTRTYTVSELKDIELTNNSFRLFSISFTDGKQYKFVVGSPRIINITNLSGEPARMKADVLNYMTAANK